MIGFMGCYAAINALKSAHHIVRSEPEAMVLILNLELCTLHMQETQDLEQMLVVPPVCRWLLRVPGERGADRVWRWIVFWRCGIPGDESPHHVEHSRDGIRHASLRAGSREIVQRDERRSAARSRRAKIRCRLICGPCIREEEQFWMRSKKDWDCLRMLCRPSRDVLAQFGNMSSATVMFVLQQIMQRAQSGTAGLCHVVWARSDRGDDALPCRLARPTFSRRADLTELMDEPCSREELRACLRDLAQLNRWLLGYRPVLRWLDSLRPAERGRPVRILDVGCGYGDDSAAHRAVGQGTRDRDEADGIDLNPDAVAIAAEASHSDERESSGCSGYVCAMSRVSPSTSW